MLGFVSQYGKVFIVPLSVLGGVITYFFLGLFAETGQIQEIIILLAIAIGSFQLVVDSVKSILEKSLALDYIAIAAISLGVITHEFIAAAIIVLMMSGGNALEKYATYRAKSSLQKLRDRVPNLITVLKDNSQQTVDIAEVQVGEIILVRKGEVIGLDGKLNSLAGSIDESSLTGESDPVDKAEHDLVRSGTVNVGDAIEIIVTKPAAESTYRKITDMVLQAQNQKTRFIRLADKYSLWFTVVTFSIAAITYLITSSPERVLAVLVIATPCPLILATPVALIGGVNSAAARNIVIKNMAVLELVDKCKAIIFDKTGT
ncbi:HAD-IC family P-type ATPase, partial [Candidatus Dojkabacteria bacterium]|nr:HAD-IC family P-type ATPase [Candidatus Dojkabacteria bacterium]